MKFKTITLLALYAIHSFNPIQAAPITAPIDVYFLPDDLESMKTKLDELLDNAQEQVLVAMYWLTDHHVISKLIQLKQKGIDIQIIFDESTIDRDALLDNLINNNIFPHISPKKNGLMHNKFLVIDEKIVLTGSTNFTKTVFDPSFKYYNDENTLIIYSKEIAQKYVTIFDNLMIDIPLLYIKSLSSQLPTMTPEWMKKITRILYEKNPDFETFVKKMFQDYNIIKKAHLKSHFPDIETISTSQKFYLEGFGDNLEHLTFSQAAQKIENIDNVIQKMSMISQPPQQHPLAEPPTQKQIELLLKKGVSEYDVNQMTKKDASTAISRILKGYHYK